MIICILGSFLVYILISEGPGQPRLLACRHIRLSPPFLGKTLLNPISGEIFERVMEAWSLQILILLLNLLSRNRCIREKPG